MAEIKFDEDNGADFEVAKEDNGEPKLDEKTQEYLKELLREKHILSTSAYPHASRLMQEEVLRTQQSGKMTKDFRYADVYKERPIKVSIKVAVPFKEHPKFNFVGKLLGPKGNSLKRLQEETLCKMSIYGRGSMKDKVKEEELRKSLVPKYAHLSDDLHVEISAVATPAEAHARIAYALAEIRKYLMPDHNDDIAMTQMREMGSESQEGQPGGFKRPLLRTPSQQYQPQAQQNQNTFQRGGGRGGGPNRGMNRPQWNMRNSIMDKARNSEQEMGQYNSYDNRMNDDNYQEHQDEFYNSGGAPENNRGRWKGASVSGASRFLSRSTPYNRPK